MSEQSILTDLISSWVSIALGYSKGAPGVRGVYLYGSSEKIGRSGMTFCNAYFDQGGAVVVEPTDLVGVVDSSIPRVKQLQWLLLEDLFKARAEFEAEKVPPPTEYRIFYDPVTGGTDVEIAHEIKYLDVPGRVATRGIEYWLGDRAPKFYGPNS